MPVCNKSFCSDRLILFFCLITICCVLITLPFSLSVYLHLSLFWSLVQEDVKQGTVSSVWDESLGESGVWIHLHYVPRWVSLHTLCSVHLSLASIFRSAEPEFQQLQYVILEYIHCSETLDAYWFEISCHLLKVYALVVSQTNRMRWRSPLLHSGSKKNQCLTSAVSRSLHIARASQVQPCPASGSKPSRRTHWPGYRHNACILTQNFPNTQSSTINTSYWYEKVSLSNGFDDLIYSVFTGAEWLK